MNSTLATASFWTLLVSPRLISVYSWPLSYRCSFFHWEDKKMFWPLTVLETCFPRGKGQCSSNGASAFHPRNNLSFLDLFHTQSELSVGVFPLSFSLPPTSFSLLPKIKLGLTLYAKTNTLLKYIVSCLHRRHEFPLQMVCVYTMTQTSSLAICCDWPVLFWAHLIC